MLIGDIGIERSLLHWELQDQKTSFIIGMTDLTAVCNVLYL